eukprot:TRINITY_DN4820_c0_g2_i1.p1 TRINITY_DN4820_c0_g2~~TRINITY_DN4820_c0_g2_i1.p1  ORF type:complete len:555 (+),score=150.52 TRINITY_DN4820_c0_g2_i1:66-1667(+)
MQALALLAAAAAAAGPPGVQPITGTFLDVAYDGRLKYANAAARAMSCAEWGARVGEWAGMGIERIVFQAVHDNRWGAYYATSLPWARPWGGACADVVAAVLSAASQLGVGVYLSAEWAFNESDRIDDPAVVSRREGIMRELAGGPWVGHAAFRGWYFSSEAYLTPLFTDAFMAYVGAMAQLARTLTPGCEVFLSPYGTRIAADSAEFVAQLKRIDADIIAYQDEVGCVRDPLPVVTAAQGFAALQRAHAAAGRPRLWANVESFTWEDRPNNATSALVPAPFERILGQLAAVSPLVERVVTFTAEALYQPPHGGAARPWGPPSAVREYGAYADAFLGSGPSAKAAVSAAAQQGRLPHEAVGRRATVGGAAEPRLTDAATGQQDGNDTRWVAVQGADFAAQVDMGTQANISSVGARFLQVPAVSFPDGSGMRPTPRGFAAYLPGSVALSLSSDGVSWRDAGELAPRWWPREWLDTRAEVFLFAPGSALGTARFVRVHATAALPAWAAEGTFGVPAVPLAAAWLLCDEIAVNPQPQ